MSSTASSETQTGSYVATQGIGGTPPSSIVTILGFVDIAQALADNNLDANVYWYDGNALRGSHSLGTNQLVTAVRPADTIIWFVYGLEVETIVDIAKIDGPAVAAPVPVDSTPGYRYWMGTVAATASPGSYPYRLELQVEGRRMTMASQLTLDVK